MTIKPPFPYYGGKARLAERIVDLMPAHRVYIEPFGGSLAVLFAKPPRGHEIVNDADRALVTFFRVLREQPDELIAACELTPYARAEYLAADPDDPELDDLEVARRLWARINQSFSKTGTRAGWSVTTGVRQAPPITARSRISRFRACAERLALVSIECCDGVDLIDRLADENTLVYADPPYVGTSRTSTGDYRVDMHGQGDHERLARVLHATPAAVMLSGYRSELYDDLFGDWHLLEIPRTSNIGNSRRTARTPRTECIWSNRPLDVGRLPRAAGDRW